MVYLEKHFKCITFNFPFSLIMCEDFMLKLSCCQIIKMWVLSCFINKVNYKPIMMIQKQEILQFWLSWKSRNCICYVASSNFALQQKPKWHHHQHHHFCHSEFGLDEYEWPMINSMLFCFSGFSGINIEKVERGKNLLKSLK